jgi:methylated-DNA-[protein]-cysteine S-methyltransferase
MLDEDVMQITMKACCTTWGWVGIAASSQGLLGLTLPAISREMALNSFLHRWPTAEEGSSHFIAVLDDRLSRYFMGENVDFEDQVLDLRQATDFQTRVWEMVRSIPRGEVRSYGWVAAQVGSPRSARAVGRTLALNPLPIVVPCHRVVGQSGELIGFAAGLDMKRRLLELEAVHLVAERVLTTRA